MRGFHRSRRRILAGVAAGVGERIGVNPVLVRAAWFCSVPFTAGLSAVGYAVLAFALPTAPEDHLPADTPALLPQAFAAFVLAHGITHVMGFLPAWRLPAPAGFEHTTLAFFGQVDLGETGTMFIGLAWLVLAVAYVGVTALLWRGSRHAPLATALVSLASAAVCTIALPLAQVGLVIDVALIAIVLIAPRLVTVDEMPARPSAAAPIH